MWSRQGAVQPAIQANGTRSDQNHSRSETELLGTHRILEDALASDSPLDGEDENLKDHPSPVKKQHKPHQAVLANGWKVYLRRCFSEFLFTSPLNILLVVVPFAVVAPFAKWSDPVVFSLNFLALLPLAERISFVTEDLAKYTNETIGGLINATMGNVTEMIVSIFALRTGLLRVVQISLLGSILSNLLLVLGSAFVVGGTKHSTQTFNRRAATTNAGLLMLAILSIAFPALLDATMEETQSVNDATLAVSRLSATLLICVYFLLIFYQLRTHRYLFEDCEDEDNEDDAPIFGLWGSIIWMGMITMLIGLHSQNVVETIEGAAKELGIPILFIGVILLPIVGNAAEHAAAIIFAYRNKMDICLGIAVGSATQISLFVIPFCVLVAWAMDKPLSLDFRVFDTSVLLFSLLVVNTVIQHGESDWLKGIMLLVAYFVAAAAFWVKQGDM